MTLRKPTYIDPATGEVEEMSPTADTIALGGITINGTPNAPSDAATVAYVQANGSAAKTVELNLPAYGVSEWTQTFSDSSVTANSSIMAVQSGQAATGKDQDETQMDQLHVAAWATGAGAFSVYVRGMEGNIHGNFRVVYQVGS